MFEQLGNIANMMKQAQEMKSKMAELQEDLKSQVVEGQAGDGLVQVEATAAGEIVSIKISPELMEQGVEALEQLIPEAINDALLEGKEYHKERMSEVTGGLNLPGMDQMMNDLLP